MLGARGRHRCRPPLELCPDFAFPFFCEMGRKEKQPCHAM